MAENENGLEKYGEIKCPFFTKQTKIPEELNRETICTKCWSEYDYNCYYPRFFDCEQYEEMLKTINPEYLKSVVDALRVGSDIEIHYVDSPELSTSEESGILPIKMFKTDNGMTFEAILDAEKHQQYLKFCKEIRIIIDKQVPYYDNKEMVFDFVMQNYKRIVEIAHEYPLAKNMKEDDYP